MSERAGILVEYTDAASNRRRIRFERRRVGGWDRIVEERDQGEWREVGHEIVADVAIESSSNLVDGVQ